MSNSVSSFLTNTHNAIWRDLRNRLSYHQCSNRNFLRALPAVLEFPLALSFSGVEAVNRSLSYAGRYFASPQLPDPREDFSSVSKDPRLWKILEDEDQLIRPDQVLGQGNPDFQYGVATCTYQDSGSDLCPDSQWASWEKKKVPKNNRSEGKLSEGKLNNFELYKTYEGRQEIVNKLQRLGVNSYRFSLEWSHIEPKEGIFNYDNLQVYVDLCKQLRDNGIKPMVTLHHFSEPLWFHQLGSFENEENLEYFMQFCEKVIPDLTRDYKGQPLVEHFCTINEPAIEAFSRYIRGAFSPGKYFKFKRASKFLKGSLKAHIHVYKKFKEKVSPRVKIGVVHQHLTFDRGKFFPPFITNGLERLVNDTSLNFFRTGKYNYRGVEEDVCSDLTQKTDFVGLQYYGRPHINYLGSRPRPGAPMTKFHMCEDPAGIYDAIINTYDAYKVPIIITENGISTDDDVQRARYITRALDAARRGAEQIGIENLQGYYMWCLGDNFEWNMGMKPQSMGAYTIDGELKEGAKAYPRAIEAWESSLPSRVEMVS